SSGVLTVTSAGKTATVSQWQAALAAVTYNDTASTPVRTDRTITFQVNDGIVSSTVVTKTVSFYVPVTPTITWTTPADITYKTALSSTQLNATATSGGNTVAGSFA